MLSRLLSFFLLFILAASAQAAGPVAASSSSLTYQGRILKSDGTPFENSNVSFVFQLLDPSGQCVIYQEQINGINMSQSGGVFDVPIGMGSVQYITGAGASTVVDVFNNDSSIAYYCGSCSSSGSTYSCSATTTPYNPVAADGRLLRVAFYDGSGWKTITPDNAIRSVPYAAFSHSAQKLGKNSVADFVLKNDINNPGTGSATCDSGKFLTWDAATKKFGCAAVSGANGGTVTSIIAGAGLSGGTITNSGTIDLAPTSVTSGTYGSATLVPVIQVDAYGRITSAVNTTISGVSPGGTAGGDLSGNYPNPTIGSLNGKPLTIASATSGQFLKYDGANWINSVIQQSDVANLSATLGGYVPYSSIPTCNSANSTLSFVSVTNTFACTAISITGSKVSGDIAGNAAGFTGALAGDVTGTQGATVVGALQGKAIATAAPTTNQVLQFDGSKWTPATISTTPSGSAGGDLTGNYPNPTLTAIVAAGTGTKITYDAKGRVTSSTSLAAGDIPALDWSKITTGKPTTLSGYGIGDAVKNGGGTGTITSGTDASKSSLTPVTGDLFVATDSQKIYRYSGSGWDLMSSASGSGGTLTSVTADAPLAVDSSVATSPKVTIQKADATHDGYLSQADWSTFNSKQAAGNYVTTLTGDVTSSGFAGGSVTTVVNNVAVDKISSGSGKYFTYKPDNTACTANQVLKWVNNRWECADDNNTATTYSAGTGLDLTGTTFSVKYGTTAGTAVVGNDSRLTGAFQSSTALGGDLSGTLPNPAVARINGVAVSSAVAGDDQKFLKFINGSGWQPQYVKLSELKNNTGTASAFDVGIAGCTSAQTLVWTSLTDQFKCQDISLPASKVTGLATVATSGSYTDLSNKPSIPTCGANQYLTYNGTSYSCANDAGASGTVASISSGTPALTFSSSTGTITANISDATTSAKGIVQLAANGGTTAGTVVQADDSRLTNSRAPAGAASGDLTGNYPSPTLTAIVTAGTGTKITYDAKGRVTASTNLSASDIPSLDWSKITSGIPTTLSGYGITDAVKNNGGVASMASGADASKGAAGTTGRVYLATDTAKVYRDNGTSWDVISSNSGTGISALTGDVTASGAGSVSATVNKVNGVAYPTSPSTNTVPVVTGANTVTYQTVPLAAGGTGATSAGAARTNLGLGTAATQNTGSAAGSIPLLGVGGLVANQLCTSDGTASGIICNSTMPTSSQWVTSGSNIYYNTGNVGIGTASPASALHVVGSKGIRLDDGSASKYGFIESVGNIHIFSNADYDGTSWKMISAGKAVGFQTSISGDEALRVVADNTSRAAGAAATLNPLMVVKTDGSVGIGTISPSSSLEVVGGIRARGGAPGAGGVNNNGYAFSNGGDSDSGMFSSSDGVLQFYSDSSEVMRINQGGNIGIGTTTPGNQLQIAGSNGSLSLGAKGWIDPGASGAAIVTDNSTYKALMIIGNNVAGNSGRGREVKVWDYLNVQGVINSTGNMYAPGYYYTSDRRLKKNIRTISSAMDKVNVMRGVQFDWKSNNQPDVGFIAQEVEAVFPELVSTSKGQDNQEVKTVKYGNIVAIVLQATKELYSKWWGDHQRLDLHDNEIENLKKQNQILAEQNKLLKEAVCETNPRAKICN